MELRGDLLAHSSISPTRFVCTDETDSSCCTSMRMEVGILIKCLFVNKLGDK